MKKSIALCDLDMDYITRFASYLMGKRMGNSVELHVFTTPESFFSDKGDYDVGLMTSDFAEVISFKSQGRITKQYLLSEEKPAADEDSDVIFKYQSIENIIQMVPELTVGSLTSGLENVTGVKNPNIVGVYSPMSHELQLPFAMALCDALGNKGKMLFVDLEEVSILPDLIDEQMDSNLMDLFYELSTSKNDNCDLINKHIRQFMGMDYIAPFINPDDLVQIGEDELRQLYEGIMKMGYEGVVLLLGRAVPGFGSLLNRIDQLILLSRPGDYFNKGSKVFFDYISKSGIVTNVTEVKLPMSAGNLKDGTYCIQELLTGNLGLFVRKLLEDGTILPSSQLAYAS